MGHFLWGNFGLENVRVIPQVAAIANIFDWLSRTHWVHWKYHASMSTLAFFILFFMCIPSVSNLNRLCHTAPEDRPSLLFRVGLIGMYDLNPNLISFLILEVLVFGVWIRVIALIANLFDVLGSAFLFLADWFHNLGDMLSIFPLIGVH